MGASEGHDDELAFFACEPFHRTGYWMREATPWERSFPGACQEPPFPRGLPAVGARYCTGVAKGWPFSPTKKTMTFMGSVVLAFFAL